MLPASPQHRAASIIWRRTFLHPDPVARTARPHQRRLGHDWNAKEQI